MSNYYPRTPLATARTPIEHIYTKLQINYASDIQDIVLKTNRKPTCGDLAKVLQQTYRIPVDKQLVYFRGQPLHHQHASSYERPLSRYGIWSGSLVRLVGRRALI